MMQKLLKGSILAGILVVLAQPVLAMSWFGGDNSSDPKSIPAAPVVATSKSSSNSFTPTPKPETYQPYKAMTVVNPGGWGSPTDPQNLTPEDMALLTKVMKEQQELKQQIQAEKAAEQVAQAQQQAKQNAVDRQEIVNSIKPLGTQDGKGQQTERARMPIPKVPVAEWEKMNQDNAQP